MSGFKDYLNNNNSSSPDAHINEANDRSIKLQAIYAPFISKLKTKLKHLPVEVVQGQIVIGKRSNNAHEITVYADTNNRGEINITQSSFSNHTAITLKVMSEMTGELSANFSFIEKTLKDAYDAEEAYYADK